MGEFVCDKESLQSLLDIGTPSRMGKVVIKRLVFVLDSKRFCLATLEPKSFSQSGVSLDYSAGVEAFEHLLGGA